MQKFALNLFYKNQDARVQRFLDQHRDDDGSEVVVTHLAYINDGDEAIRVLFWDPEIEGYSETIKISRVTEGVWDLLNKNEWTPEMLSTYATGYGDLFRITLTDGMELLYARTISVDDSMLHIVKE